MDYEKFEQRSYGYLNRIELINWWWTQVVEHFYQLNICANNEEEKARAKARVSQH